MTRVAIGIPTLGPPTWRLFDSFGRWQAYHYQTWGDIGVSVVRPPREMPVDMARSYIVQEVLKQDFDWLWFTDQDAVYLPETLERLMRWSRPIVGALCMMRDSEQVRPMLFRGRNPEDTAWRIPIDEVYNYLRMHTNVRTNEPQVVNPIPGDSLYRVDFTGCHCLLIKREVLESIPAPWFSGVPGTEDRYFCLKAANEGYKIYVDFSTFVGHAVGSKVIGVRDYIADYVLELALATEGENGQSKSES